MGLIKHAFTAILVFTFMMAGANKVSNQIHPETHEFLCKGFANYGKNVWHDHLKSGVKAAGAEAQLPTLESLLLDDGSATYKVLMRNIGFIEVVCAVMLLFGGLADKLASFILFCIMVGATFTHFQLNEPYVVTLGLTALICARSSMKGVAKPASKKA